MPLFDYQCENCGKIVELLIKDLSDQPQCTYCGSFKLKKLISAHSSYSGTSQIRLPGAGDTGCCGSKIDQARCEGPGSCCGKGS
jgi:putative FmdB family regulatory protein